MICLLIAVIILLFWRSGIGLGLFFLAAAVLVFVQAVTPNLSIASQVLLVLYVLAAPLAGFIAGMIVSRYCFSGAGNKVFAELGGLLALMLALRWPQVFDYFGAAYQSVIARSASSMFVSLLGLGTAVTLTAVGISLGLIAMAALIELPCRWLFNAGGVRTQIPFEMLRPLLVVLMLCLALQVLAAQFANVFNPHGAMRW